jgi:hypothetical protein
MRIKQYIDRFKERKSYYKTNQGSFFGMMLNYILYGSSVNDYFMYRFYEKSASEKKTYITCKKHQLIQKIANAKEDTRYFSNKAKFNTLFGTYIKRDWLDIDTASVNDIEQFLSKHRVFFLKDKTGCEGKGVQRTDNGSIDASSLKNNWGGTWRKKLLIHA